MRTVFADSHYFFALIGSKDEAHAQAVAWTKSNKCRLVTTEWVLTELADGLASSQQRGIFLATREMLLGDKACQVVPLSMELYGEGLALYAARPDKAWSLTDCISFVVMKREGITEAFTGDHHFEQAGFVALLK